MSEPLDPTAVAPAPASLGGAALPDGLPLRRSVGLGVATLVVLFVIDAIETSDTVRRAVNRLNAGQTADDAMLESVSYYVVGNAVSYLLIGLVAGLVLHFWLRLLRPARPLRAAVIALPVAVLLAYGRQAILHPGLHDWFLFLDLWASHVPPEAMLALMVLPVCVSLVVGYHRSVGLGDWGRRVAPLLALALSIGALWRVSPADPAVKNDGPNILVFSFDAMRTDHIHHFGYERDITPNLDRFLSESTVWENAYTPLARTQPAWTALLTGTLPITNEVRDPLPEPSKLVPKVPMLPQVLKERGYHTAFLTDDSRFNYMVPEHGFDTIVQPPPHISNFAISGSEPSFRAFYGLLDNPLGWFLVPAVRMNQAFGRSYENKRFNEATLQAIADASAHERFFLAIHDCSLHSPADRYYPYTLLFDQASYQGKNRFRYASLGSASLFDDMNEEEERAAAQQNINLYDAGMVMIDETFAGLRAQLEDSGLWENSIVVLMSDHGEDFYEPDLRYSFVGPNHGFHPWGRAQHNVVLGIHWPASMAAAHPPGRETHLTSLIDVVPTLAEALGIPWKGDGRSLFDRSERVLYVETGLSEKSYWSKEHKRYPFKHNSAYFTVEEGSGRVFGRTEFASAVIRNKDRFVMDERYKLIWYPNDSGTSVELFDWVADPNDRRNVAARYPGQVAKLWAALQPRLAQDGIIAPELLPFVRPTTPTPAAAPAQP